MKSVTVAAIASLFFSLPSKAEEDMSPQQEKTLEDCVLRVNPHIEKAGMIWCSVKAGRTDLLELAFLSERREAAAYCLKDYDRPDLPADVRQLLADYCANKLGIGK